jgi:hypothetical protein
MQYEDLATHDDGDARGRFTSLPREFAAKRD